MNPPSCKLRPVQAKHNHIAAFTLIELAIVLVIIGLVVGGVMVGRDLIGAATVRAQISQIEKYQTAVNTFRSKYNALPGDLNQQVANTFGFVSRGQYPGEGDGNGFVEGVWADAPSRNGPYQQAGESCMFWVDLSTVSLIDNAFSSCSPNTTAVAYTSSNVSLFLPPAKIGNGNYIYVWSFNNAGVQGQGANWFGLSAGLPGGAGSTVGLKVVDAYNIDKKIDDGQPQTGNVTAMYLQNGPTPWYSGVTFGNVTTTPIAGSSTTCFDNGNVSGPQSYSMTQNNGAGVNCALSFRFQ